MAGADRMTIEEVVKDVMVRRAQRLCCARRSRPCARS